MAHEEKLDSYHVTNILRAFSRSQGNRMNGIAKTYYALEPVILREMDSIPDRDITHLMYSYAVRNVGNPELHAAFEKRLDKIAASLDHPGLFNAIYYMLFRENANESIWRQVLDNTVSQESGLPLIYYKPFKCAKLFI